MKIKNVGRNPQVIISPDFEKGKPGLKLYHGQIADVSAELAKKLLEGYPDHFAPVDMPKPSMANAEMLSGDGEIKVQKSKAKDGSPAA